MKKILPILLFTLISTIHAERTQLIDAIAIDVEGEAITTLEITSVQKNMKMSKKAAIEALIYDRLEKSALKKANIQIDPAEIQQKIQSITRARNITQQQMKEIIEKKGLSWDNYIEQLTTEIEKEHFFREHIMSTITPPNNDELEAYYNLNKNKFAAAPTQMSLVAYGSQTAEALKEAIENPMRPVKGVQKKNILASSNEMSPALLKLIQETPSGNFTKPVKTQKAYVSYFVKSKGIQSQSGFQSVKKNVLGMWMQEQRGQAGKDFFNKLKSSANIRMIRI